MTKMVNVRVKDQSDQYRIGGHFYLVRKNKNFSASIDTDVPFRISFRYIYIYSTG